MTTTLQVEVIKSGSVTIEPGVKTELIIMSNSYFRCSRIYFEGDIDNLFVSHVKVGKFHQIGNMVFGDDGIFLDPMEPVRAIFVHGAYLKFDTLAPMVPFSVGLINRGTLKCTILYRLDGLTPVQEVIDEEENSRKRNSN